MAPQAAVAVYGIAATSDGLLRNYKPDRDCGAAGAARPPRHLRPPGYPLLRIHGPPRCLRHKRHQHSRWYQRPRGRGDHKTFTVFFYQALGNYSTVGSDPHETNQSNVYHSLVQLQ
jgi:hypothetical protein